MTTRGWKTYAIGRHLVDVPSDATLLDRWKFNGEPLEHLGALTDARYEQLVQEREQVLRNSVHKTKGNMFIERVSYAGGSLDLISWRNPNSENNYWFDSYYRAGAQVLKQSGLVSPDRKSVALKNSADFSQSWQEVPTGGQAQGIGFVVRNAVLADKLFNSESWSLAIRLPGKEDVSFSVSAFALRQPDKSLRQRAGGVLAGMLGLATGLNQLRNRERTVNDIWGEEILVAGNQNGKRHYGFKWESPGQASSLAEPNLNVQLQVGESAFKTNAQSFANDEDALALWDAVVSSIRLRPGAAG
jgi:Tle cognate immunity protein 4 C-terminal domain